MIDIVTERCECAFTGDRINNEELLCDLSNPTSAIYRAKISSTNTILADDVVAIIEQWITGGATVTEGLVIVTFDSTCPVRIGSNSDPICEREMDTMSLSSTTTVIGASVAVVIVLIVVLFTAAMVLILWQTHRYKKRCKKELL